MQLTWGHFSGKESNKKFSNNGVKVNGIIILMLAITFVLEKYYIYFKTTFL